ncbi:MAG: HAD family phosphatase [Candidatus Omnitrophota bacterium]
MNEKKIKAVFFDLGNVIIRFNPEILEEGYASFGKVEKGKFVDYIMGSDNVDGYMEGKLSSSRFYTRTRRLFRLDMKYNEFYSVWNSMFFPYPEMEEIVRALKVKYPGIKLVLVSNTNEAHYEFLKKEYEILDLFDGHVVSHEVGKQKPHPAIFSEALKTAGCISKNAFFTDDRPELVEGARTMGIHAFLFTGHNDLKKQLSKYNIHV